MPERQREDLAIIATKNGRAVLIQSCSLEVFFDTVMEHLKEHGDDSLLGYEIDEALEWVEHAGKSFIDSYEWSILPTEEAKEVFMSSYKAEATASE